MTDVPISENTTVFLNFSLALEDGQVIDSNFDREPVSFTMGDGSLLPGFERKLLGLKAGESATFKVMPEDAFGQPNDNNLQRVRREQFANDEALQVGMMFSFADAAGGELPGVVVSIEDEQVTIDFNHPLAGKVLTFDVAIHGVEPAELH